MKWINLIVVMALFAACTGSATKEESTAKEPDAATETNNQLTAAQKAEGWRLLFDGKTMNGWRTYLNKENNSWEVVDGTLHTMPFDSAEQRADLITTEEFANFELSFDWKISPQGNSGVIYRVTEEFDEPYKSGPEYQLLDDVGYPGQWNDVNMTGAVYDMYAPENKQMNPVGEWNTSKVVVNGNHVEHWLNGGKVLEYDFSSDDWKARKEGSKWKEEAGYGVSPKGYIDLQDHGGESWFRNIMIKPLQ